MIRVRRLFLAASLCVALCLASTGRVFAAVAIAGTPQTAAGTGASTAAVTFSGANTVSSGESLVLVLIQQTTTNRSYTCSGSVDGDMGSPPLQVGTGGTRKVWSFVDFTPTAGDQTWTCTQSSTIAGTWEIWATRVSGLDTGGTPVVGSNVEAGLVDSFESSDPGIAAATGAFVVGGVTWTGTATATDPTGYTNVTLSATSMRVVYHVQSGAATETATYTNLNPDRAGTAGLMSLPAAAAGVTKRMLSLTGAGKVEP